MAISGGAIGYGLDALAVAIETGDLEGQALAHNNIGVGCHLLGDADGSPDDYDAALDHYRQAKALNRRLGRPLQGGMTAANMAQVQIRRGDDAAARRLLCEALTEVRRSGGTAKLLFCVLAEADRRLLNGDQSRGLELIGIVRTHSAFRRDDADEIDRILGRAGLPPDVVAAAVATGGGQNLAAAVDELIDELTTDADP